MKRLLILLTLITMMLAVGVVAECTDTDNGKDYATKGTTTYSTNGKAVAVNTDICTDSNTLIEYFCDSTGKTTYEYYTCKCVDGACTDVAKPEEKVKEEVPAEVPKETPAEVPPVEAPTEPVVTPVKVSWFSRIINFFRNLF